MSAWEIVQNLPPSTRVLLTTEHRHAVDRQDGVIMSECECVATIGASIPNNHSFPRMGEQNALLNIRQWKNGDAVTSLSIKRLEMTRLTRVRGRLTAIALDRSGDTLPATDEDWLSDTPRRDIPFNPDKPTELNEFMYNGMVDALSARLPESDREEFEWSIDELYGKILEHPYRSASLDDPAYRCVINGLFRVLDATRRPSLTVVSSE